MLQIVSFKLSTQNKNCLEDCKTRMISKKKRLTLGHDFFYKTDDSKMYVTVKNNIVQNFY